MLLRTRTEAGRLLARKLEESNLVDPVVLGLPRGGVPVAFVVAEALQAPLDVIVVRKLGVPGHQELAMGAVGEGGILVVDRQVVDHSHVHEADLSAVEARERAKVVKQAETFRAGRPAGPQSTVTLQGRTLVLVDDGLATGSSMLAACRVARAHQPARIVVAVPVAPAPTLELMRQVADAVVCLHTPHPFMAVGLWYHDFTQVSDAEVVSLLRRSAENRAG